MHARRCEMRARQGGSRTAEHSSSRPGLSRHNRGLDVRMHVQRELARGSWQSHELEFANAGLRTPVAHRSVSDHPGDLRACPAPSHASGAGVGCGDRAVTAAHRKQESSRAHATSARSLVSCALACGDGSGTGGAARGRRSVERVAFVTDCERRPDSRCAAVAPGSLDEDAARGYADRESAPRCAPTGATCVALSPDIIA